MKRVKIANKDIENKVRMQAGYLNLPDTAAVRTLLIESPLAKGIMHRWRKERNRNFGVDVKNVKGEAAKTKWDKSKIWEILTKSTSLTATQLAYTFPLPADKDLPSTHHL